MKRGLAAAILAVTMLTGPGIGTAGGASGRPDAAYLRALLATVTPGSPAHFRLIEDTTGLLLADGARTPAAPAACGFRAGGC